MTDSAQMARLKRLLERQLKVRDYCAEQTRAMNDAVIETKAAIEFEERRA